MATVEQVAEHFGAAVAPNVMVHPEVTEGLPALVVFEKNGRRILRNMTWGFPRLTRGDPPGIIGLVADLGSAGGRSSLSLPHRADPLWQP
jgi:hypothetical protein